MDFFQGLLILGAMLMVSIFAAGMLDFNSMSMVSDSSAFASDIYKPLRKNQARDKKLLWVMYRSFHNCCDFYLSLFWKRLNFTGAVVDISWYAFLSSTGIYELIPGFFSSLILAIIVSLCTKKPSDDVKQLFVDAVNCKR